MAPYITGSSSINHPIYKQDCRTAEFAYNERMITQHSLTINLRSHKRMFTILTHVDHSPMLVISKCPSSTAPSKSSCEALVGKRNLALLNSGSGL